MRKHFNQLTYLDQENLDFLTKYLKHALYYPEYGSLDDLLDIGTFVKHPKLGIVVVVGYCGTGSEYILYENDRDRGYGVKGTSEDRKLKAITKLSPMEVMPLLEKMNDYLLNNSFKLSTSHQKSCYEHWLRTGDIEFVNPIGNEMKEKLKIQNLINQKKQEIAELEVELKRI